MGFPDDTQRGHQLRSSFDPFSWGEVDDEKIISLLVCRYVQGHFTWIEAAGQNRAISEAVGDRYGKIKWGNTEPFAVAKNSSLNRSVVNENPICAVLIYDDDSVIDIFQPGMLPRHMLVVKHNLI